MCEIIITRDSNTGFSYAVAFIAIKVPAECACVCAGGREGMSDWTGPWVSVWVGESAPHMAIYNHVPTTWFSPQHSRQTRRDEPAECACKMHVPTLPNDRSHDHAMVAFIRSFQRANHFNSWFLTLRKSAEPSFEPVTVIFFSVQLRFTIKLAANIWLRFGSGSREN